MSTERTQKLEEFVAWAASHMTGDEKGEAQLFLDHLFRGFGWPGLKEAGATCEQRVKKDGGGTSFADLVWKPVVVIEMKKRGADLKRHYRQAFDYWTRLVPNRPRYAVLCNFDEFWVYDFDKQMDTPVDQVKLVDLPRRYGPLAFLFPGNEKPVFGNDQERVTREAADKLAGCFNSLITRKVDRATAQRFTLQTLLALFAEDIGLLDKYLFTRLLDDARTPSEAYDLIGGLFEAMNTPSGVHGGRFKGVRYFNGGLFSKPARIELTTGELNLLREAAKFDWSQVRPEIFGALFEHSLGKEERHAYGAHFTSPSDIMKIVGPTIVEPWRARIEAASTLRELRQLLVRIESYTVLDPACGSGNFLYVAYRELKRLEARIYERMAEEYKSIDPSQRTFGFVTSRNFYGMDINPFAVEIAKVTMMLARKLAIDEFHITEDALPLDNLDDRFLAGDALIQPDGTRTPWPKVDVIIGNPPFLGAKRLKPERGVDYVNGVREAYPEVPGMADYCVYWFRRAHDALAPCTAEDPLRGRAGLVGTQNIRNNASRVGGLDHVTQDGTIVEAVDNQPWSGEANVHVSIANWVKTQDAALLPKTRRLWSKADAGKSEASPKRRGSGPASKVFDLDFRDVGFINSALSDQADVSRAVRLLVNSDPKRVYQGVTPGHDGFVLDDAERTRLSSDGVSHEVIHAYLTGREIVSGDGMPERWIIDFQRRSVFEAQKFTKAFAHVQAKVLPDRKRKADEGRDADGKRRAHHKGFLERWWHLSWDRKELFDGFKTLGGRFIACPRVTKRPTFVFMSTTVWPSDKVQAFLLDDDYSFGILQSDAHWRWFTVKCSKLKSDFSYSIESVFDTFPWPQAPTAAHIEKVAAAGREVRRVRAEALQHVPGGLRGLYRTLELPGKNALRDAHAALDAAVLAAYGFNPQGDLLAQLLDLNLTVAARIGAGEEVQGPGIPAGYRTPKKLVTADCIEPLAN